MQNLSIVHLYMHKAGLPVFCAVLNVNLLYLYYYLFYSGMFVLVYLFVNGASFLAFDERMMYYLPISIYLSTKMWMYYTWVQATDTQTTYAKALFK
jgi:hypothetical protein